MPAAPLSALEARLRRELRGEVLFDAFSRGRYSTDASIYQIEPLGVVVPRSADDAVTALALAAEADIPILPRGAGTSQCGQTVGAALVIDNSKFLNRLLEIEPDKREALVQPGLVLDHLNAALRKHALCADPSFAIGGVNTCDQIDYLLLGAASWLRSVTTRSASFR